MELILNYLYNNNKIWLQKYKKNLSKTKQLTEISNKNAIL